MNCDKVQGIGKDVDFYCSLSVFAWKVLRNWTGSFHLNFQSLGRNAIKVLHEWKMSGVITSNKVTRVISVPSLAKYRGKGKGEVVPVHTVTKYRRSRIIDPLIVNLSSRWTEWSTSRPGRFTPGKEPRYPLDRRLGGPRRQENTVFQKLTLCRRGNVFQLHVQCLLF
jgi:hypothetical protein